MANKKIAGITVEISGDTTKLGKALQDVDKKSRDLKKEIQEVNKALKLDPTNTELLAQKQKLLAEQVKNSKDKLDKLVTSQKSLKDQLKDGNIDQKAYDKFQEKLKNSRDKLQELYNKQNEFEKALADGSIDQGQYDKFKKEVEAARQEVKNLETAENDLETNLKVGNISEEQYRAYKREVEETKGEITKAEEEQKKFNDTAKKVPNVAKEIGETFEKTGEKVSSFGDTLTKTGEKATAASAVIVGAAAASYKAWSETDEGYDTIVKKTGATGAALEDLTDVANKVFTSLPVDMNKVGTAVGEINTRFSATGDELESLTKAFIKFSEVNDTDVNSSVDNVSASMKAFGVDSSQAQKVLDKLTSIAQRTGIPMSQLESTLASQSATFKEMGLSLGEAAELLGQFEINGVDTNTAISSLKKAQQNAAASGKTLSDELKKNVTAIKSAGTETEALQIATELFGKKGAAAMVQAIREDRMSLDSLDKSLEKTAGTVDNTFEATIHAPDRLKVALNQVKLQASELAAVAMEKLAPSLKKLTDRVNDVTQKFNSLSDSQKTTILEIAGIIAAAGPLLIVIGKITSGVGGLISSIGSLFNLAAANPWVLAIAAVVAALGVLYVKNEDFRNFVNTTAKEILAYIKEIGKEFQQWYKDNKPLIDDMIKVLTFLAEKVMLYLMKTVKDTMEAFKLAWTVISSTWSVATSFFSTIWENIKLIFSVVKDVLTGDFSGAWDGIKQIFSNTGEFFTGVWESIKSVFSGVGGFFYNKFSTAWDYAKKAFGLEKVGKAFGDVKDKIVGAFKSIPEAIEKIFNDALDKAKNIAGKIGDEAKKITDKIPGVSTAKKAAGKIKSKIPFLGSGGVLSKNGDVAVVGEAGPELLRLLNGKAVVTPFGGGNSKATVKTDTSSQPGGRTTIHQTYNVYVKSFASPEDARQTSQKLAQLQKQTDFGKGIVTV